MLPGARFRGGCRLRLWRSVTGPVEGACLTVADQPVRLQVWGAQRLTRAQSTDLVSPRLPRPSSTSLSFSDRNVFSPSSGNSDIKGVGGATSPGGSKGKTLPPVFQTLGLPALLDSWPNCSVSVHLMCPSLCISSCKDTSHFELGPTPSRVTSASLGPVSK